jgi:hypothetical protein
LDDVSDLIWLYHFYITEPKIHPKLWREAASEIANWRAELQDGVSKEKRVVFGEKPSRKTNHKVFALKQTISQMKHLQESQEIGTEDVEKLKKVRSRQNRIPI